MFLNKKEEEKEKEQNAKRIKEAKISNLEIKGIKGELYDYQKLGVEFLSTVKVGRYWQIRQGLESPVRH